jgi:hypothetical protein
MKLLLVGAIDGPCFTYVPCADDKWRVIAGWYLTMDEAREPEQESQEKNHETD